MAGGQPKPRIDLKAAQMAVQWKHLFATELKSAAEELATGSHLVTVEHYRQALPEAISRVLRAAETESVESADAQRRVA